MSKTLKIVVGITIIVILIAAIMVAVSTVRSLQTSEPVKQVTIDSTALANLQKNKLATQKRVDSLEQVSRIYEEIAKEKEPKKVTIDANQLAALQKNVKSLQSKEDALKRKIGVYKEIVIGKQRPCLEEKKETTKTYTNNYKKRKVVTNSNSSNELVSKNQFKPQTNKSEGNEKKEIIVESTSNSSRNLISEDANSSSVYSTSLSGAKFIGLKDGDFYISVFDGYIQYVFSAKLYKEAGGTGIPEFNSEGSGKFFELSADGTEYVYTDVLIPANAATVSRTYAWTVFIGKKSGYSAYLPHEVIKPEIIKARGDLAGTISPEDLIKIAYLVPEVNKGMIKPNKLTAIGDYDGLTYEGWHFCTPVLYQAQ